MNAPEPLEQPEAGRLAAFPVRDPWCAAFLARCRALFWVPEEINENLARDSHEWPTLAPEEQRFIKHVLAFFAVSDAVVNQTISDQLAARIQPLEIRMVYNFQRMIEDVHNVVYSKLVETYASGEERARLFDAVQHFPAVRRKLEWCQKYLAEDPLSTLPPAAKVRLLVEMRPASKAAPADDMRYNTLRDLTAERIPLARALLVNCLMEGLFFSGSFCAIFWVGHYHKKLPGLTKANEFISRDEGLHTEFGIHLYGRLAQRLPEAEVHRIVGEAAEIESAFIAEALPAPLRGINATLMGQYVRFVADQLLGRLGYRTLFQAQNPFPWMAKQSIGVRSTDFFQDAEVTEYGHHAVGLEKKDTELDFSTL